MTQAWETVDCVDTPDGELKLLRRREDDFIITIGGRVLMNSHANRSELAIAELACRALGQAPAPNVLIGGLGMGCTLRAALALLPLDAQVTVVELNPVVADWCGGPLAAVCDNALADPRVRLLAGDVAAHIRRVPQAQAKRRYDAIIFDLYEGPHARSDAQRDPLYGQPAIEGVARALTPEGVFSVWSEDPDAGFEARLRRAGFDVECVRPGRGGRRHAVYVARKAPGRKTRRRSADEKR